MPSWCCPPAAIAWRGRRRRARSIFWRRRSAACWPVRSAPPISRPCGAIYDSIGQSLTEFAASAAEGERERSARLSVEPDTQPLRRTLLRLRHDVITVGRIARGDPLPEPVQGRLAPRLAAIGQAGSDYLRASGMRPGGRRPPPSEAELEQAFVAALAEITALRREGFTRELTDEAAGRFFALAFALEEMRRTFRDLGHDVEVTALAPEQATIAQ